MEEAQNSFLRRFGDNLRRARLDLGLSQEEVSERAGITDKYLSEIENAKRSVRLVIAARLARALGRGLDDLLAEPGGAKRSVRHAMDVRLADLVRRLEHRERQRAYAILKAAFGK